jgi:hypothetical protein
MRKVSPFDYITLFFFLKEKEAKRIKNLAGLSLYKCRKEHKKRASPARDVCSCLTNIRRNYEAKKRFTDLLWTANAL